MDEILYTLCRHDVGIMDGYHPLPATTISEILDLPVGKVRYHLNKLRKQGLVDTFYEGGQTEDGEVFCYHGWTATKLAFKTEEYKKAYEEERQLCKDCFDIDIGELKEEFYWERGVVDDR